MMLILDWRQPLPPAQPPVCQPPTKLLTALEARAPLDWLSVLLYSPHLIFARRGNGAPVMLVPGYMTSELSMRPLKLFLNKIGHNAHDWELGRNRGNVRQDVERVSLILSELYEHYEQPVSLVGWSLGGVISRELARLHPEKVKQVITMGTPISGGPKYTFFGNNFKRNDNLDIDQIEREIHERNLLGITQPITSIYSKSDGIVGWKASLDRYNPQADNIEVFSSHLGLGINGKVWRIIADKLAS